MAEHINDSTLTDGQATVYGHDHGEHHEGHGGLSKYLAVFGALLVLTIISFAVGASETLMSNPAIGWTIMMAVSCTKALLVMLFFMHLIWEANWKYVLTIPATIMSVFLILMLFPDIKNRTNNYSEERWLYAATPELHDEGGHAAEGQSAEHDDEHGAAH